MFKSEKRYAVLKKALQIFTDDLQKIINNFGLLITKQSKAYYLAINSYKLAL